jgi:hypothetical protein
MSVTPEDRAPSSLRIVNYDPSNPIHAGIVRTKNVNTQIDIPRQNDVVKRIVMPVAPGNEEEPKLSGRHMTNEENAEYVVPKNHRIKQRVTVKKPALQTESQKATSKEDLRKRDIEVRNARLAASKKK